MPEKIDSLMMAEKYARRSSRHLFKRDVGRGSSSHTLIADFRVTFFTMSSETGRKSAKGVPEKRWWLTTGRGTVWESRLFQMAITFPVKKPEMMGWMMAKEKLLICRGECLWRWRAVSMLCFQVFQRREKMVLLVEHVWLTVECSHSASVYKHASLDGKQSVNKACVCVVFQTTVKRFGDVQIEPRVRTHVVLFTKLV